MIMSERAKHAVLVTWPRDHLRGTAEAMKMAYRKICAECERSNCGQKVGSDDIQRDINRKRRGDNWRTLIGA
jgi:hypothetical protein